MKTPNEQEIDYDLSIDKDLLDDEWNDQPQRFFIASAHLADAKKKVREMEASLELADAELSLQIRKAPEKFGLSDKLTEAMIKDAIKCHVNHKCADKNLREAQHTADMLSAFVSALDQRKRGLGDLVALHGQGYFSVPARSKPGSKKGKEMIEDATTRDLRKRGQRKRDEDDDE